MESVIKPVVEYASEIVLNTQQFTQEYIQMASSILQTGWTGLWSVYDLYHYLDSFSDPKLRNFPLMGTPCGPLTVLAIYFTILYYGQDYVHGKGGGSRHFLHHHHHHHSKDIINRPFFVIVLVFYNVTMSALNAWISFELLYCGFRRNYNFLCQLVYTETDDPYETRIAEAIWWYFASKGIELLDTCFIILKRKPAQLTFLHIYHHSSMFAVWWVGAKFVPGGSALTGALVNCVVHVVMYGYYALSAAGPIFKPYLWWKKYLTIIQLVQFTMGVSLGLNSIISHCPFTRWMQYVFVAYAFSFLVLFGNFYRRTYLGSKKSRIQHSKSSSTTTAPATESSKPTPTNNTNTANPANRGSPMLLLSTYRKGGGSRVAHGVGGSSSSPGSSPDSAGPSSSSSASGGYSTKILKPKIGVSSHRGSRQTRQTLSKKHNYGLMGKRKKPQTE